MEKLLEEANGSRRDKPKKTEEPAKPQPRAHALGNLHRHATGSARFKHDGMSERAGPAAISILSFQWEIIRGARCCQSLESVPSILGFVILQDDVSFRRHFCPTDLGDAAMVPRDSGRAGSLCLQVDGIHLTALAVSAAAAASPCLWYLQIFCKSDKRVRPTSQIDQRTTVSETRRWGWRERGTWLSNARHLQLVTELPALALASCMHGQAVV